MVNSKSKEIILRKMQDAAYKFVETKGERNVFNFLFSFRWDIANSYLCS